MQDVADRTKNMDGHHQARQALSQIEQLPSNFYLGAVVGSIALSAALFLIGKKNMGIFVGLWPPTILNLAVFAKYLRPSREVE